MQIVKSLLSVALCAASVCVSVEPAFGADRPDAATSAQRTVFICETDAATRRAYTREHGVAPIFVTARAAMSVRASDPAWTTPRCMTPREHARYRGPAVAFASAR